MKLLIEIPTWLGDAVMCTPAIQNVLAKFNNPEVTIIGSLSSIELFENNNKITKTIVLEKNNLYINSFSKSLGKFDLFISFRGSFRSKLLKFFVLSKKKYQFNKNSYKNLHQVEKYNDFIKKVCELAEINQPTKGSKMKETEEGSGIYRKQSGTYKKHELVTSHIGRRSFATNFYGKIPTTYLIYITGHSTESMFLNYIGKSNKDLALDRKSVV